MTPDKPSLDESQEREKLPQDDPSVTTRVKRSDSEEDAASAEAPAASTGIFQQIWHRIKEERSRPTRTEISPRGQSNMDRSKAFLVLATAVVLCGFAFLALFSTSSAEKRAQDRRTKPSLGRPESAAQQAGSSGSTIPLLNADQSPGDQNPQVFNTPQEAIQKAQRDLTA